MKILIAIILFCLSCVIMTTCTVKNIQFNRNCEGYLKRAADANTVETAKAELEKAIAYMDAKNLKVGYTSVIYTSPSEDVEFWYNNISASYKEVSLIDSTSSQLEKSNMLMKLRETLLDNSDGGTSVTMPAGISRYPNNTTWMFAMWLAGFLFLGAFAVIFPWDEL